MEIKYLNKDLSSKWDEFCIESDDAWFWHTSKWINYNIDYGQKFNSQSKSFAIIENNKIIAIAPLLLENREGYNEFSLGYDAYGPAPALSNNLDQKNREKTLKFIFNQIDDLAKKNNIKRIRLRFPALSKSFIENNSQKYNTLVKFNYFDNSINTQIIDLSKPIEELKKEMRHGHIYDINKASKILKITILDKNTATKKIFDQYVNLHHKASGRKTRSSSTFNDMFNWIKEDDAILILAKKNNTLVSASYFSLFKNNAFYFSSCSDPDFKNIPASHLIQWHAIKWMKNKKYKFYEIGWQNYPTDISYLSTIKEVSISKFKRGFGGFTTTFFMGEKFYDRNLFKKLYTSKIEEISNIIQ